MSPYEKTIVGSKQQRAFAAEQCQKKQRFWYCDILGYFNVS